MRGREMAHAAVEDQSPVFQHQHRPPVQRPPAHERVRQDQEQSSRRRLVSDEIEHAGAAADVDDGADGVGEGHGAPRSPALVERPYVQRVQLSVRNGFVIGEDDGAIVFEHLSARRRRVESGGVWRERELQRVDLAPQRRRRLHRDQSAKDQERPHQTVYYET